MQANKWTRSGVTGAFADTVDKAERLLLRTLDEGGATYAMQTGDGRECDPITFRRYRGTTGYVVSDPTWHRSLRIHDLAHDTRDVAEVAAWLQSMPMRGDGSPVYVGSWTDDDGLTYFDVNDIVADYQTAQAMGVLANQRTIYDLERRQVIPVGLDVERPAALDIGALIRDGLPHDMPVVEMTEEEFADDYPSIGHGQDYRQTVNVSTPEYQDARVLHFLADGLSSTDYPDDGVPWYER